MNEKREIRHTASNAVLALEPEQRIVLDAQIATHITRLPFWSEADTIVGYMAIDDEVDVQAVLRAARRDGKTVALPRVESSGGDMTMRSVTDFPTGLVRHSYGMLQPSSEAPVLTEFSRAVVLVPGRAFDRAGRRVGRGAGYYDRFLAAMSPALVTIGVAYSIQLFPQVPADESDLPVEIIVTEVETCFCKRPKKPNER